MGYNVDPSVHVYITPALISAFGLDFNYDSSGFKYLGVGRGTLTGDWANVDANEITPGIVRIGGLAWGGTIIPTGSTGSLVVIFLQNKCVTPLNPAQYFEINSYTDGIADYLPSPAGKTLSYFGCQRLGDVNGDSNLTPGDAQKIFEYYLGLQMPDFC
jgi:hypothetical protein